AVVLGHSVGEIPAAWAAGVMSLEDALRLVAIRGRLMQAMPKTGAMLSVETDELSALAALAPVSDKVSLPAVNGARQGALSGEAEALSALGAAFEAKGQRTKRLTVSHAFHSPLMEPMLDGFEAALRELRLKAPERPLISNLTGRLAGAEIAR